MQNKETGANFELEDEFDLEEELEIEEIEEQDLPFWSNASCDIES